MEEARLMETSGRGGDQMSAGTAKDGVERRMKMKVMVAIDESEGSFYALKWALHNLIAPMAAAVGTPTPDSNLQGNEVGTGMVLLVHVQPKFHTHIFPLGPGGTAIYTTPAVIDSVKKAEEELSATVMSRALKMCKDKMVKAESIIVNGDPREMICQVAEQMHVDLLIMGSRGLGILKRAILGSVSDYCAHHAKTPILIVKPSMEHRNKH